MQRWSESIAVIIIAMVLAVPASAQAPKAEVICLDPAVIYCDNFEDRPLGVNGLVQSLSPKTPRYGISTFGGTVAVVNTPAVGSRAMKLETPANSTSGGGGGMRWAGQYRTIYYRLYNYWSTNYKWSPIATKNVQIETTDGSKWDHLMWFGFDGSEMKQFSYRGAGGGAATLNQNVNLPAVRITPGQWYCLEMRLTASTGGSPNGTVEAWIDGVKKWNYPTVVFDNDLQYSGFSFYSYWNCPGTAEDCSELAYNHPTIQRYMDNVVVSTKPIGCMGAPSNAPLAPRNLRVVP